LVALSSTIIAWSAADSSISTSWKTNNFSPAAAALSTVISEPLAGVEWLTANTSTRTSWFLHNASLSTAVLGLLASVAKSLAGIPWSAADPLVSTASMTCGVLVVWTASLAALVTKHCAVRAWSTADLLVSTSWESGPSLTSLVVTTSLAAVLEAAAVVVWFTADGSSTASW